MGREILIPRRIDYLAPGEVARLPQWRRGLLTETFPGKDIVFPDASSSTALLEQRFRETPELMVPNKPLVDGLLLAGGETYDDLRTYAFDRLSRLGNEVEKAMYFSPRGDATLKPFGMNTDNIKTAFSVVEQCVSSKKRDTGEPTAAHFLRVLIRGMDLIEGNLRRYNGGKFVIPFTPEVAELLLLTTVLHDFTEDGHGNVHFNDSVTPGKRRSGVALEVFETGEFVNFDIHHEYWPFFKKALDALDKRNIEDDQEAIQHLKDTIKAQKLKLDPAQLSESLLNVLAPIVKCLDRMDNVSTRTFTFDKQRGIYVPQKVEGVKDKVNDTSRDYPGLETIFNDLLGGYVFQWVVPNRRGVALKGEVIQMPRRILDNETAQFKPSRWAAYMRQGMGPNQIFFPTHVKGRTMGLPAMV